jgi:ABC-type transport system involved in Fe-S cluster assembly fused permease/ATPase subunit
MEEGKDENLKEEKWRTIFRKQMCFCFVRSLPSRWLDIADVSTRLIVHRYLRISGFLGSVYREIRQALIDMQARHLYLRGFQTHQSISPKIGGLSLQSLDERVPCSTPLKKE